MAEETLLTELPLSQRLREGTRAQHVAAESCDFIQRLFRGQLDRQEYARYLAALAEVYATLEDALQKAEGLDAQFSDARLYRLAALRDDLQYFADTRDATAFIETSPAATREAVQLYRDAIIHASAQGDGRLVPHAYVRYLGDLSGGQMIAGRIAKSFGLTDDRGLQFYRFPLIPDTNRFKEEFRARLDALPLTPQQGQALEEEARNAFRLNIALFNGLS